MSIYDEFRALQASLFADFDAPNATLTRTVAATRTPADRAAGRMTTSTIVIPAKAILGSRKVRNDKGAYQVEQVARIDAAPETGDRLAIGSRTWEVTTVEEINPDSTTAIIFVAGLK